jgi:glucose-1-phosphate cytidylyltransferase
VKAVILAGGLGTRMGDDTVARPKPLVEIGGRPILWHILKIYEAHGILDFIICAGYAGNTIAEYFAQDLGEPWRVDVVDTGETTATAGRLRRVRDRLGDEAFCMTYGDGVGDVDIRALVDLHRREGRLATLTAAHPRVPFGVVTFPANGSGAVGFAEKPILTDMWLNSGFFVLEPRALDYVERDDEHWERGPMTGLARDGQLAAYRHEGFWQCMDAPRDRQMLETLWRDGNAPWKVW